MALSNERSDGGRVKASSTNLRSHDQRVLEIARQIALDSLRADRQAVEINPPSWTLSSFWEAAGYRAETTAAAVIRSPLMTGTTAVDTVRGRA